MSIVKYFLYRPNLLLFVYLGIFLYFFASHHSVGQTVSTVLLYLLYMFIFWLFFPLLRNSLLRITDLIPLFRNIPNYVLVGYWFIFMLFNPVPAIILAIFAKIFIRTRVKHESYMDSYGNMVTHIKSLTPTVILSRKQKNGEEEHIVMTKLKKKPKKITYE